MSVELFVEKYRPTTLDEYVWRDPGMRQTVEEWLAQGALPHALFSGVQGTGKTSLSLLLMRLLHIPDEDILKINASRERKVDGLQDKVVQFIDAWAFNPSGIKYVILDEADRLSPHAQGLLRNEMETYAHCCRFVLTCNYPHKIIPAIHSRVQEIKFAALDLEDFLMRSADVLVKEGIRFDPELLMQYKDRTYPDLRKCLGMLQQNSRNGELHAPHADEASTKDYLLAALDLFKQGQYVEGRKLIIAQANPDEYDDLYRMLYQNIEVFAVTADQQDEALLAIRRGLVYDVNVGDREINLAATLLELTRIARPLI